MFNNSTDANLNVNKSIISVVSDSDYEVLYNINDTFEDAIHQYCTDTEMDILNFNFTEYYFPRPENINNNLTWKEYAKIIVCFVTICAVVVGNGGVITAVALNRSLRTTINYYLTNLAFCDLLIAAFCLWIHQVNDITKPLYVLGPFICKFNAFTQSKCKYYFNKFS